MQSAITHAGKALALTPDDTEARKLLCRCLLDAGRLQATAELLTSVEDQAKSDSELTILMIRLKLLQQDLAAAQEWAGLLHEDGNAASLIQLGNMFEHARQDELASGYFDRAVENGFYTEALLGLSRITARQKDWPAARGHVLSALNLETPPPVGTNGPAQIFQAILNQIRSLDRPREQCRAWVVDFPPHQNIPSGLHRCRMMIFAPVREAAVGYLDEILNAMQPSTPSTSATSVHWSDAPKNKQPERPVYPGVQGVL